MRDRKFALVLLAFTLVLPSAAAPARGQGVSPRAVVRDVALDQEGLLLGQVVDAQGRPIGDALVWLYGGSRKPIAARTNADGQFAYRGLQNGVYRVCTGDDARTCRVWAAPTAPPRAARGVMLVADEAAVRAQHGPPPMLNGFVTKSKKFFAHPLGMIAIGAAIATPIAIVAADDDDPAPATP